jgi:uncharacterized membrane protein
MLAALVEMLRTLPPSLATVILSALPVTELRLSIPVAIHVWKLTPVAAFAFALLGNFLPFFPLYFGLDALRRLTQRHAPWLTRFIDGAIARAKGRVSKKYARYGAFALFLFTAIPLPLTGLWTATLAAVALKVPLRYALAGIGSGIVVAGVLVTLVSAGFI